MRAFIQSTLRVLPRQRAYISGEAVVQCLLRGFSRSKWDQYWYNPPIAKGEICAFAAEAAPLGRGLLPPIEAEDDYDGGTYAAGYAYACGYHD